ncbi:MAG: FHA domain-containing protein [Anaerolineae bacterium]|nr:FHA domain-containing protein [Anaerolineae bacterium]
MTTEIILLLLRLISSLLLLTLLGALFIILWREYRRTAITWESQRRSHGSLVMLREIDGKYLKTGEEFPLLPITSLGRSPTNSIPINDNFASSEHALVTMRSGQWWLEDRKSRNGTMLNDVPVTQPMVITEGDIIGIGNIKLRLELEL